MAINFPVTVPNGQTVSGAISTDLSQHVLGLEIPVIDSATLYIQASNDGVTFRRALKTDGSGDWNVAVSTGNRFIFIDQLAPFKFFKIELSAVQSADRTFNFVLKNL